MKNRIAHVSLLLAALLAAGSHLDLAQVFAWGRMFAGYAQEMPLTEAVAQTFNPESACALCRAIGHARKQQESSPLTETKVSKKILLAFAPKSLFIALPVEIRRVRPMDWHMPEGERPAPAVPPPRTCV